MELSQTISVGVKKMPRKKKCGRLFRLPRQKILWKNGTDSFRRGSIRAERTYPAARDKGKIQQVLYNLIDNAIKFSHADSTITVETTSKYEKIFVSVRDTGIGIPKNSLKKIWERFYKTDLSRGKDKKGTGLGLAIVKEIIQLHGENINVVSTEGVGTEFIFSLSKAEKEDGES